MSTTTTHHIIMGMKFPFDSMSDEAREKLRDFGDTQPAGLEVVIDGMGTQYVLIGKPLARFTEEEPLPLIKLDPVQHDPDSVLRLLLATFSGLIDEPIKSGSFECGVWAVSHIR